MKLVTSNYRLNTVGFIGVVLFLIPGPLCVILQSQFQRQFESALRSARFQAELGIKPSIPLLQSIPLEMFAIASFVTMLGLVLLLIGRDIVTHYPDTPEDPIP